MVVDSAGTVIELTIPPSAWRASSEYSDLSRVSVRMTPRVLRWLLFTTLLLTVGCDHATKHGAATSLRGGRVVELVPELLDLRYVENHDVAFSLLGRLGLEEGSGVIGLLALLTVGVMTLTWFRRRATATRTEHVGFALALAGGIGNVLDRFTRGFVVDFIHIHHWPVFNVADMAVAVGMGLVLLASWRSPSDAALEAPLPSRTS